MVGVLTIGLGLAIGAVIFWWTEARAYRKWFHEALDAKLKARNEYIELHVVTSKTIAEFAARAREAEFLLNQQCDELHKLRATLDAERDQHAAGKIERDQYARDCAAMFEFIADFHDRACSMIERIDGDCGCGEVVEVDADDDHHGNPSERI